MTDAVIGSVVDGRYRVIRLIGSGGMGHVYEASHELLQRKVALKVLVSTSGDGLKRFERECEALKRIEHDGIPVIYGWGTTQDGRPYIAMEFCAGRTLEQILSEQGDQPLNSEFVCAMTIAVADCLAATHAAGIVHRDIKPSNIMISHESGAEIKLLDFGIAHAMAPDAGLTGTNQVLGSAAYLSPEHLTPKLLEPRSDIYSLGCVMYRALSGKEPNDNEQGLARMLSPHKRDPLPKTVPLFLRNVVNRCLAFKIGDRFESAQKLAETLKERTLSDPMEVRHVTSPLSRGGLYCGVALIIVAVSVAWAKQWQTNNAHDASSPIFSAGKEQQITFREPTGDVVKLAARLWQSKASIEEWNASAAEIRHQNRVQDSFWLRKELGRLLWEQRRFSEAESVLKPLVDELHESRTNNSDSNLALSQWLLAQVRIETGNYKQAAALTFTNRKYLQSAEVQQFHKAHIAEQLGDIYLHEKNMRMAEKMFSQAIQLFETCKRTPQKVRCLQKRRKTVDENDLQEIERADTLIAQAELAQYIEEFPRIIADGDKFPSVIPKMIAVHDKASVLCSDVCLGHICTLAIEIGKLYEAQRNTEESNRWYLLAIEKSKKLEPVVRYPLMEVPVAGLIDNNYAGSTNVCLQALNLFARLPASQLEKFPTPPPELQRCALKCLERYGKDATVVGDRVLTLMLPVVRNKKLSAEKRIVAANFLSPIQRVMGRKSESIVELRALDKQVRGKCDNLAYCELLHNLGVLYKETRDFPNALKYMLAAHEVCLNQHPPASGYVFAVSALHLGTAYLFTGEKAKASALFVDARDQLDEALRGLKGSNRRAVVETLTLLDDAAMKIAALSLLKGSRDEADKLLKRQKELSNEYHCHSYPLVHFENMMSGKESAERILYNTEKVVD